MPKFRLLLITLIALSAGFISALDYTPHQLIFKSSQPLDIRSNRTGLQAFDGYLDQLGAYQIKLIPGMHLQQYYLVNLSIEPDWSAVSKGDIRFAGIDYIQPNNLSELHIEPNDPLYPQQFHNVTSNDQAWNYTTGSSLIVVGVVDSGCLVEHPDLAPNLWINDDEIAGDGVDNDGNGYIDDFGGWDFADAPELSDVAIGDYTGQDNDVEDENFHGTHVAGIIGAAGNNGIGVTGVAWNVKIMPIRAGFRTTAGQGYLQDDDAAASIIYATDNGCQVINMSWGDPNYSPIIGDACNYAYSRGVTLVASAGNDPGPYLSYPAKLSSVISVGAINRNRNIAGFSSYGADLDLVAPGELVLSTYKLDAGQQYFEQSGTSMSSPFVAGAAALLLSLNPGLTPSEVRARLLTSTDDLGASGIDVYYGHGLLNTRKLLENTQPPLVYIDRPVEFSGIIGSQDIIGTVTGDDFFRYTVTFSKEDVPTTLDWYDVETHQNYPDFHTQQVTNGVLAHFNIPESFPEGRYTLRIQYENTTGRKYNYYRSVTYDQSAPALKEETVQGFKRYDGQNLRFYVSAIFDEPVRTELIITASDNQIYRSYSSVLDSLHVWTLPTSIPEGEIDIQIVANNTSGLSFQSNTFSDFMDIRYEIVSSYGYNWQELGAARVPLNYLHDYDGDGTDEYIAMDLPNTGYGNVYVYQPQAAGHVVKHDFDDTFWLLSAGNTNASGEELLLLKSDTATLLESQLTSDYPSLPLWEATSITGGVLADYSNDGADDVLLVQNLPAERVIQAFRRSGNTFVAKNTLHNDSDTNVRNTFVPTIVVKDLDNDSFQDILTADTDGDVMIYEIRNDNLTDLAWSQRLPIGNTYQVTSGDYDGNGRDDFFVGGYYRDNLQPNLNFWYFEGFKNVSNNSYASMGQIMFNNVTSQNSIQSADLDNDGKEEIILAISPNLYILEFEDAEFKPTFYGSSFRTYSILARKDQNNRSYFMTNYSPEADSVLAVEWTADDPYMGPPTPANFQVVPQNSHSIKISWIDNGAEYYVLYRRNAEHEITSLDGLTGNTYWDTELVEGEHYEYAITAYDSSFSPPESVPTVWQGATPFRVPEVVSVTMVSPLMVEIVFNQQMASSIVNPILYYLDNGMGHPSSVNSILNNTGVLLHFNKSLPSIEEAFTITMSSIVSSNGIYLQNPEYTFNFQADTTPPNIEDVEIQPNKMSILVKLSEQIADTNPSPEVVQNYNLICPPNDTENSIASVDHLEDSIEIHLNKPLKHSSSAYFITVNNIRDLAGNSISLQGNIARFSLDTINNLKNITVYPNPVQGSVHLWVSFINFPDGKKGHAKIFDSSGNLVLSTDIGPFNRDINNIAWHWDLCNNLGAKVSSGVYFYVIEMDGEIAKGKVAIIN